MCELTEIRDIVRRHLRGDYSDTLTRFSYLNGGAQQFIRLTQNPDYTSYDREMRLLEQIIPAIINLGESHVVDLGVGDGMKSASILSRIGMPYLGLDLSPEMIEIARMNHEGTYSICDFSNMNQLASELRGLSDTLVLMLGNTITNELDVEDYLNSLNRLGINHLLVGAELFQDNVDEILREYRTEENYALTARPLEMIGMEGRVDIDFDPEQQRIEEWFTWSQGRVLLSVTYKPSLARFREWTSGWNEMATVVDEGYALMLLENPSIFS